MNAPRKIIVTQAHLTPSFRAFRYIAEASELGLRPGEWPSELPVAPNVGNGQPLVRIGYIPTPSRGELGEHDVAEVIYEQRFGDISVRVAND